MSIEYQKMLTERGKRKLSTSREEIRIDVVECKKGDVNVMFFLFAQASQKLRDALFAYLKNA